MAENKISNRQAICEELIKLAEKDKNIVVLTSDSRGSGSMSPFIEKYPEQHVETGIAEQNIVGIAAGLAKGGKKPVVVSPASFLSMRSIEQIKVDVAYSHANVILLGISGGFSYGALGMTHHSLQDMASIGAIPGIDVILPADRFESVAVINDLMKNPRPAYIRIGRNAVPDVYDEGSVKYIPGKATIIREGFDACIIATGEMVYHAVKAADILKEENIFVKVINMHTIKPLDAESVKEAAKTKFVLTIEEHSVIGGLGSQVASVLAQNSAVNMKILAVPDEPAVAGTSSEVREHYGLTTENIVENIKAVINKFNKK